MNKQNKTLREHSSDNPGELEIQYCRVSDVVGVLYEGNKKLHDIGAICSSIARYGFRAPVHYDKTLQAIDDGNGRVEALAMMESKGWDVPRGIKVVDGEWYMPVVFGVDAASVRDARSYVFDANNLNLMGGDGITAKDMMRMYSEDAIEELISLAQDSSLPESIDADDLDLLLELDEDYEEDREEDEYESEDNEDKKTTCPECGHVF